VRFYEEPEFRDQRGRRAWWVLTSRAGGVRKWMNWRALCVGLTDGPLALRGTMTPKPSPTGWAMKIAGALPLKFA